MRVISVCSGAGGKDLGFHRAGFETVALCEFDPWRQRLLARNFPGVPCWPDLAELDPDELPDADVLIGGTPCQDLSTAGRRAGLDGERSGLFWHYMRVRNALGIPWAVWENVEGALTSNQGLDFACVLGAFVGSDVVAPAGGWPGAGVAAGPWGGCVWRVLDAQHFGVPQRRRRVFVVGHLGGPCPPEVLLEPARGQGDLEAGERAWTDFAGPVGGGAHGAGRRTRGSSGPGVSEPGRRQEDDVNLVAHTLTSAGFDASEDGTGRGTPLVAGTVRSHMRPPGSNSFDGVLSPAPDADGMRTADGLAGRMDVAPVTVKLSHTKSNGSNLMDDLAPTLSETAGRIGVLGEAAAGDRSAFDPSPDGRRYSACGDGVVAPVAEWIGRRLRATAFNIEDRSATR